MLRNPHKSKRSIGINIAEVFELPGAVSEKYLLKTPWAKCEKAEEKMLVAGQEHRFALEPFEVLALTAGRVD